VCVFTHKATYSNALGDAFSSQCFQAPGLSLVTKTTEGNHGYGDTRTSVTRQENGINIVRRHCMPHKNKARSKTKAFPDK
jgi:hypothetical protein